MSSMYCRPWAGGETHHDSPAPAETRELGNLLQLLQGLAEPKDSQGRSGNTQVVVTGHFLDENGVT